MNIFPTKRQPTDREPFLALVRRYIETDQMVQEHQQVCNWIYLYSLRTPMAYSKETNSQVNRSEAEALQKSLFAAASEALELARADKNIPAALLSSVQSILKDAGLSPDLQKTEEANAEVMKTSAWVSSFEEDLGL